MVKKIWLRVWMIFLCGALFCALPALAEDISTDNDPIFKNTLNEYFAENEDACWFCNIFGEIYDAINTLTTEVFNELAKVFIYLMGAGILFLLLFKIGRMLVQLQDVDVMQFLNDLFKPLGRAIIATALLGVLIASNTQTIFYLLTTPVMEISLRMGEGILANTLGEVTKFQQETSTRADSVVTDSLKPNWEPINQKAEEENSTPPDTALGEATKMMLVQWLKSVSSSFIVGIALGGTFMKIGFKYFVSGGFSMFLSGLFIWFCFWVMYLTFPFKIIDAFVRIVFVLMLMPLWVVLWVFQSTQQYSKRAWDMFLSSCFLFVTISIMIAIILMLVNNVVPNTLYGDDAQHVSIDRSTFYSELLQGHNDYVKHYISLGCGMITNTLAIMAMGGSLLAAATSIANAFVGGGANIQTNVAAGITGTTMRVGGLTWSVTKAGAKTVAWGGSKAVRMARWFRDSRRSSTGTAGGGETGGGGDPGGGAPGGGGRPPQPPSPPPNPPIVLPAETGDTGEDGRQGEDGHTGGSGRNATAQGGGGSAGGSRDSTRSSDSSGSVHIPTLAEAGRLAAERENELYEYQRNPTAKNDWLEYCGGKNERQALVAMDQAIQNGNVSNTHRQALKEAIIKDAQIEARNISALNKSLKDERLLLRTMDNPAARDAFLNSVGRNERQALINMEQGIRRGENIDSYGASLHEAILRDMGQTGRETTTPIVQEGTVTAIAQEPASAGALPRPLSEVSPERMRAIQGLAKEEGSVGNLRRLAQDVSFIEQSMGLSREDFKQAIAKHEWQTDARKMQSFAGSLFDAKGRTIGTESVVTEMLKGTYMSGMESRDTVKQIAQDTARERETDLNDRTLSSSLNELSQQVAAVQSQKSSDKS